MQITLDKLGRVVLPKWLRERYGLHPGTSLEIAERAGEFALRPADAGPSLVNKHGVWVHQGRLLREVDIVKEIEKDREERIRFQGGL